jgi:hypothetical protein
MTLNACFNSRSIQAIFTTYEYVNIQKVLLKYLDKGLLRDDMS